MRILYNPRIICKIVINKCIKKVTRKKTRLEHINLDKFHFYKDEAPDLIAKISYFQQAKIFKQRIMKNLPPERRSKSAENQCIKSLRSQIWDAKKELKKLGNILIK